MIVFLINGVALTLGVPGLTSTCLIGDDIVGYRFKTYFTPMFTGFGFFTTLLTAMLWTELNDATKSMRNMRNIFYKKPFKCFIAFIYCCCTITVLGNSKSNVCVSKLYFR